MGVSATVKRTALWASVALTVLAAGAALIGASSTVAGAPAGSGAPEGGLEIAVGPRLPGGGPIGSGGTVPDPGGIGLDRLEAAIADLDCSRLQVVDLPRTGEVELRGHVPASELVTELVAASQRLVGDETRVVGNLMVVPPPLCGVLESVEALGLRQSGGQWNDPLSVGVRAWAELPRGIDGQAAEFRFRSPDYDAHVYVDYFDGAGTVQHLMPSDFRGETRVAAGTEFSIGNTPHDPHLVFSPPLGLDIALVIATSAPLYDGIRPSRESAAGYLAWLDGRVWAERQANTDFHGEWAFVLVLTEPG